MLTKTSSLRSSCRHVCRIMVLLSLASVLQSCYHYTITSKNSASTETQSATMHNLFWGLAIKPRNGLNPPNCAAPDPPVGFHQVKVTNNFGYSVITVVTLGIWSPMKVEWQCAKPCQPCDDVVIGND